MRRIVVVEDDPDISDLLAFALESEGYEVLTADTGESALALIHEQRPDVVTLDLTLPDLDGTEVCRRLRAFSSAYVMMITGRSEEADRLVGLEIGADDYLAKPFSAREVRARVAALLRRPRAVERPERLTVDAGGGLVLVPVAHVAVLDGVPLPMTPVEVDLLCALAAEPERVWDRAELVAQVWQGGFIESDYLVDLTVASARRKLRKADPSGHEWIRTVEGAGYAFAAR
ncbi:response regulator transcription factor [Nocardioides sp. TRM66260-LWL]|uniref:response regulator transcription factor n=1 Tax=Nocardioides sp. TRM66260-LWL TaxID=2874478 RepID=UPI001CC3FDF6|nr:response regulator transcription factor [Nocardioides sp. TRM66260-LWL]MBZ5732920.1 response regulator transcription factor [Nocardioides sp. TRM66260-LWL]